FLEKWTSSTLFQLSALACLGRSRRQVTHTNSYKDATDPSRPPSPRQAVLNCQESSVKTVEMRQDPTWTAEEIKILNKLHTSPYRDRKDRNPDRIPGTCEWFVEHKLFRDWQESKS